MNDFSLDHQFSESAAAVADAAIRIIASRGLGAVSVREVAKESGFAAGSVQYHAPNRDTLLAHAFIRSIQRESKRVAAVPEREDELETWIARLYTEVLGDFQRNVVAALGGEEDAKPKARLVTALINGLTLDNLRVPESEADRIVADLREGLRLLFAG